MSAINPILNFLTNLRKNNSKEWMQAHKPEYLIQKAAYIDIVQNTIDGVSLFDKNLHGLEPKNCIFRINRDIRFSADKTLYKTHFGAYMALGGRKAMLPGYYLHLEPGDKSMLAAGLYRPGTALLNKVRQEIDYNGGALTSIVESDNWKKNFGQLEGERLTRSPKGYSIEHQLISYLQLKSYLAVVHLTDDEVSDKNFPTHAISKFEQMHPLVQFLNRAIS